MPYAKIDVGFIRQHLAAAPEKHRAAAIALYVELVLTSAELLLDGVLPSAVVLAGAHEIGISRGRYGRAEVHKIGTSLAEVGLVELQQNDTWRLIYWADHHHSREYVDGRRKSDADRKKEKRGQLTIGGDTPDFHKPRPQDVRSGHGEDSRAHARRRSTSESEDHSSSTGSRHAPPDDDDQLRADLERLGVNDQALLTAAATDPARAAAWIVHAHEHADRNPAGYWRTNFTTGAWPPSANGKPKKLEPGEWCRVYVTDNATLYADEHLVEVLRDHGATDDDLHEYLDLAADLRRAAIST